MILLDGTSHLYCRVSLISLPARWQNECKGAPRTWKNNSARFRPCVFILALCDEKITGKARCLWLMMLTSDQMRSGAMWDLNPSLYSLSVGTLQTGHPIFWRNFVTMTNLTPVKSFIQREWCLFAKSDFKGFETNVFFAWFQCLLSSNLNAREHHGHGNIARLALSIAI